jgi:hypothetical protein
MMTMMTMMTKTRRKKKKKKKTRRSKSILDYRAVYFEREIRSSMVIIMPNPSS